MAYVYLLVLLRWMYPTKSECSKHQTENIGGFTRLASPRLQREGEREIESEGVYRVLHPAQCCAIKEIGKPRQAKNGSNFHFVHVWKEYLNFFNCEMTIITMYVRCGQCTNNFSNVFHFFITNYLIRILLKIITLYQKNYLIYEKYLIFEMTITCRS